MKFVMLLVGAALASVYTGGKRNARSTGDDEQDPATGAHNLQNYKLSQDGVRGGAGGASDLAAMKGDTTYTPPEVEEAGGLPFAFPTVRYSAFTALSTDALLAARALNYNVRSWNLPGINPVEENSFDMLNVEQQAAAIALGLTQETWDCYQNHYDAYSWEEMEDSDLLDIVKDLEYYNVSSWNDNTTMPFFDEFDDEYWVELIEPDQRALTQMCYFEQTWDGVISLLFDLLGPGLTTRSGGSTCDLIEYDTFFSFHHSHLYVVAIPTQNEIPDCQFPLVFHDQGGTKAAYNFTIGVNSADVTDWLPSELMHVDRFMLGDLSASFELAKGFGTNYSFLNNNCFGVALTMAADLGIMVYGNNTILDFAVANLATDETFLAYVNSDLGSAVFGLSAAVTSVEFAPILRTFANLFLSQFTPAVVAIPAEP